MSVFLWNQSIASEMLLKHGPPISRRGTTLDSTTGRRRPPNPRKAAKKRLKAPEPVHSGLCWFVCIRP